jgi:hypothetical protein
MHCNKILNRIKRNGKGWVFCPKYFYDITDRVNIDKTLSNLTKNNIIERISRGIYYYPRYSSILGHNISPSYDKVAKVYADSVGMNIIYHGAKSANMLDLSLQVPMFNAYLCNKKSMIKKIGNYRLNFKKSYIANLREIPEKISLIIAALDYLGKEYIDEERLKKCSKILNNSDRKILLKISDNLSYWLRDIVRKIAMS